MKSGSVTELLVENLSQVMSISRNVCHNFINKYYPDNNCVFWLVLVSAHYSNVTQEVYKKLNIKFVPKDSNPPNVSQLCPIEHFWAYLKERFTPEAGGMKIIKN